MLNATCMGSAGPNWEAAFYLAALASSDNWFDHFYDDYPDSEDIAEITALGKSLPKGSRFAWGANQYRIPFFNPDCADHLELSSWAMSLADELGEIIRDWGVPGAARLTPGELVDLARRRLSDIDRLVIPLKHVPASLKYALKTGQITYGTVGTLMKALEDYSRFNLFDLQLNNARNIIDEDGQKLIDLNEFFERGDESDHEWIDWLMCSMTGMANIHAFDVEETVYAASFCERMWPIISCAAKRAARRLAIQLRLDGYDMSLGGRLSATETMLILLSSKPAPDPEFGIPECVKKKGSAHIEVTKYMKFLCDMALEEFEPLVESFRQGYAIHESFKKLMNTRRVLRP